LSTSCSSRMFRRALFTNTHPPIGLRSMSAATSSIKKVGILGAGQMGGGIAQVAAQVAGLQVILVDNNQSSLDKSLRLIDSLLTKGISKGKLTEDDKSRTLKNIFISTDINQLNDVDIVIEAVSENPLVKDNIFKQLDKLTSPHTILASNTSSISITKIASNTNRPDKVIGMHFMNPVPVMKLVEVIPGLATSQTTVDTILNISTNMGKTTTISRDMPGFVANRLLMPYINEAVQSLYEGIANRDDIDTTMKLGCGMPMGPLTLADFIGLDTCLSIMKILHTELGDSKYRPSPLLVKYVEAGWLGKKSGRGFYQY